MNTRLRILEAAIQAYGQKGFRGATTRRIAALAGVNEVTIFRHFGSKQALLAEALRAQPRGAPVDPLPAVPNDPIAELTTWTDAHSKWLVMRGQVLRASMGDLEERPELADGMMALQEGALTELSDYFERLRARGFAHSVVDFRAAAAMLIATVFADATYSHSDAGLQGAENRARSYATVVLTALGVGGAAAPGRQQVVRAPAPPSDPDATGA